MERYDTLFALLKSSLWGEQQYPFTADADTDWASIYMELRRQTVQHLPVDILCRVDTAQKFSYIMAASNATTHFYRLMREQSKLCGIFRDAGIPFVILKGAAAACYYPTPTYRNMGDVDVIVKPCDFDRARELLVANGFSTSGEKDNRHEHLESNGVVFELHRYFALMNDAAAAGLLDQIIYDGIDHAGEATLEGFSYPMLPACENGLVLLDHICQHLETGLGLRQIIDWMMFVNAELDDEMWHDHFEKSCERLGLRTLAVTASKMCQLYLGLRSDITWCDEADDTLCRDLMAIIMDSGNFGRKQAPDTNKSVDTLLALKNIPAFFHRLQYRGANNWPILKKHPRLRPFAWIYQLFRYIHRGLSQDQPLQSLARDVKTSRHKDDVFTRLEIPRKTLGCPTPDGMRF